MTRSLLRRFDPKAFHRMERRSMVQPHPGTRDKSAFFRQVGRRNKTSAPAGSSTRGDELQRDDHGGATLSRGREACRFRLLANALQQRRTDTLELLLAKLNDVPLGADDENQPQTRPQIRQR